jgi:hypothetical protein
LKTVRQLLEGRERWRAEAKRRGLLSAPKPAPVPVLVVVDGAVAEQPTLGVRLYSACACGLTPSGKEVQTAER